MNATLGGFASIGECMLELSDEKGERWRMGFAGDALNTAWYVRALCPDRAVDFISAFGDDPFSLRQRDFLEGAGIGTGASPIIPGARPGLYAITLNEAERSFSYWRSDSAARSLASDLDALRQSLQGRDLVYLTGITLAILSVEDRQALLEVVRDIRMQGTKIAFDPNHRPKLWNDVRDARTAYMQMFSHCDIVLPTWDDEAIVFGDHDASQTISRLRECGVEEIVVKRGADDAVVVRDGQTFEIAVTQTRPVDTTGAGDSFVGGYLAGRLSGLRAADAAALGHKVASRVIAHYGALIPVTDVQDLRPQS